MHAICSVLPPTPAWPTIPGFMKIEHVAFNVSDPVAMSAWYCTHLSMQVKRKLDQAPFTHFLADSGGQVMVEIYRNPPDAVPDYRAMHPLLLHLAFVSLNPSSDRDRLLAAGASLEDDLQLPDGSHLVMLRDPWGLAIQLCKRASPMV
jgi:glyoxylase I family protein